MTGLVAWPEAARKGQVVPKNRVYAEAGVDAALERCFVEQVAQVRWAYKLATVSVQLPETPDVAEIQVFEVDLKGAELHDSVLAAIDRAIPSPIVFELRRDDGLWAEQAMAAGLKRRGARGSALSRYYRSGWVSTSAPRVPLPVALNLERLHEQLVGGLLPHPLRPGERLAEGIERMEQVRRLEREAATLERRMRAERQFNRQTELRRQVLDRRAALAKLTAAG